MSDQPPRERLSVEMPDDWGGSSDSYLLWYETMARIGSFFAFEVAQTSGHYQREMERAVTGNARNPGDPTNDELAAAWAHVEADNGGLGWEDHLYLVRYAAIHMAVTALEVYLHSFNPNLDNPVKNAGKLMLAVFVRRMTSSLHIESSNRVECAIAVRNKLSHQDSYLTGRPLPPHIDLETYCGTDDLGHLRITDDLVRRTFADLRQFVHAIEAAWDEDVPDQKHLS